MNCPCGEKAVSFGPFGNACPAHVPSTVRDDLRVLADPERAILNAMAAGLLTPDLWREYEGTLGDLCKAVADFKVSDILPPRRRVAVRDSSRCSCGARASRWYEGGASCWFCVPRRTTPSERAIADLSVAWQANLGRVEAIARRTHRRRQVLGIAQQTKDQYPVALRDWELWQVARVQEDGRLKGVLKESAKGEVSTLAQEHIKALKNAILRDHPKLLDRALGNVRAAYPNWTDKVASGLHRSGAADAWIAWLLTVRDPAKPVDPAPYFHVAADWDAAFYKALQTVGEDERVNVDACYQKSTTVVIDQKTFRRGRAPGYDPTAQPGLTYYPRL